MSFELILLFAILGLILVILIVLFFITRASRNESNNKANISFKEDKINLMSFNEYQGMQGENEVDDIIQDVINTRGGESYKRIILEDKFHNYTEIDNLYVSLYGIFIIETKSWSGNVIGSREDNKWQSILGDGDIIHDKENPFIQNERHIKFFERVFHPRCEVTPIVVFISHKLESIECRDVVLSSDLRRYLRNFEYQQMDRNEYEYLTSRLNTLRDNPVMSHEEYAEWQKEHFKNK